MAVYVDDVRNRYGRMFMCHMWADSMDELLAMADTIGVAHKWLQRPPKASWVHFDICYAKKKKAIAAGAILTDRFEALAFVSRLNGNAVMLANIAKLRRTRGLPSNGILTGVRL